MPEPTTVEDRGEVIVLNAGSSTLKFALYPWADEAPARWWGRIDHLDGGDATLVIHRAGDGHGRRHVLGHIDHMRALFEMIERATEVITDAGLAGVGHRVVHGGPQFDGPVLIGREVVEWLHAMDPYDPAHQAIELAYIEEIAKRWPYLPQVASFDTTFHHGLAEIAQRLPVPRLDATRGLRRYGFHGLSYTHAMDELRRIGGEAKASGRVVLAHLGSGASLAAVRNGRCVDTTMGFTPTGGIPMGRRSGDVDPGVFFWLARHHSMTAGEIFEMMTRQSGLLAISELTSDLEDLLAREREDLRAADAVEYFCYHVRKAIGALAAVLGGVDTIVFTGGIGEHQPVIRERICAGLSFLGIRLDPARNAAGAALISPDDTDVEVRVIPADEERIIARGVRSVLGRSGGAA